MFDVNKIENMTMEEINDLMANPTKNGLTFGDVMRVAEKLACMAERMNKACSSVSQEDIKKKDMEIYRLKQENEALRDHIEDMESRIRKVIELIKSDED